MLGVALVCSALLTAVAWREPAFRWLGWISFLPLVVAARRLRPLEAALAGALWGAAVCLFTTSQSVPGDAILRSNSGSLGWILATLVVIPGVYVGLAALRMRTRAHSSQPAPTIDANLFLLALGWTLVEALLHFGQSIGPHDGLLTGNFDSGWHVHWLARLGIYLGTAFLVLCANASLATLLGGVRLRLSGTRFLVWLPPVGSRIPQEATRLFLSWIGEAVRPRAPPACR